MNIEQLDIICNEFPLIIVTKEKSVDRTVVYDRMRREKSSFRNSISSPLGIKEKSKKIKKKFRKRKVNKKNRK